MQHIHTVDSKLLRYASFPKMERVKAYPVDMTLHILLPLDKTACVHTSSYAMCCICIGSKVQLLMPSHARRLEVWQIKSHSVLPCAIEQMRWIGLLLAHTHSPSHCHY